MQGFNLYADAVQSTLGPSGKSVIIHNLGEEPTITKDGVTVGECLDSDDPVINTAIQLIKKVASKMDSDSGDGTTTASVLCRMIIKLGLELKKEPGFNEHNFKMEMEKCLEYIIDQLKKHSIKIPIEKIGMIAATSANNDNEIGNLFQHAFNNAGESGYINIVESVTGKSYVDIIKGYVLDLGYSERRFSNNLETGFFEAKEAYIVIIDNEITDKREMLKIVKAYKDIAKKLPTVIIAKDFSKDVVNIIDYNNMDIAGTRFCLIKNHLRNDEYLSILNDVSNFTGAQITKEFDEFDLPHGIGNNLIVKQGYTVFGDAVGTQKELLDDYLYVLKIAAENEKSAYHADLFKKRISKMQNGVTTFYVGADSEVALKEKKHRVEDAYNACKLALRSHVIIGGGQSLLLISISAERNLHNSVLLKSITEPFRQILINSHHEEEAIEDIYKKTSWKLGYNAKTRNFENLFESGIIDPLEVTLNGLKNSFSLAMTILNTECLIVDEPQK
jgi:chaperonin GroEL